MGCQTLHKYHLDTRGRIKKPFSEELMKKIMFSDEIWSQFIRMQMKIFNSFQKEGGLRLLYDEEKGT